METISPELALVDERLDAAARLVLPDVPDCLRPPRISTRAQPTPRAGCVPPGRPGSWVGWLPVALLALAIGLATVPWRANSSGSDSPRTVPLAHLTPSAPESITPRTSESAATRGDASTKGAALTEVPGFKMHWRSVPNADFYNVIFWRSGRRVLDLWPTSASLHVTTDTLEGGVYQWYVYPAFRSGATPRYGPLVARGQFSI